MSTLIGPKPGDLAHVAPGSRHEEILTGHGWRSLAGLSGPELRALAPEGLKLPPAAKPPLLAELVSEALLAGSTASPDGWKAPGPPPPPEPDPPKKAQKRG